MAVAKGIQDTKYYTMGCKNLYVATDHSALVTVLGDQSMADVENPRLSRIKEKTLWWHFKILHTPGKKQLAAYALSRRSTVQAALYKLSVTLPNDDDDEDFVDHMSKLPAALYKLSVIVPNDDDDRDFLDDMKARVDAIEADVHAVMRTDEISVITWDRLYEAAQEEPLMVKLMEVVLRGFPQSSYDEELRPYQKYRHELHIAGGVLQGQGGHPIQTETTGVGMISRVEDTVFWPGISPYIIKTRGSCLTCVRDAPAQPAGVPVAPPTPCFPSSMW